MTKTCSLCLKELELNKFNGRHKKCNSCRGNIYYSSNKEHKKISQKYYYSKNQEVIKDIQRKKQKEYLKTEEGRIQNRIKCHNRRVRINNSYNDKSIDKKSIDNMLILQQGKCLNCGCNIKITYTIDHIIPLSKGGEHTISNIQLLCLSCNSSKGSKVSL